MNPAITFVGAGSVEFTKDLLFDLFAMPELVEADIRLYDIDDGRLETALGIAERVAKQRGAHPRLSAHSEIAAAVDGTSFVINAVAVGGHAATLVDFEIPKRFGLRQTIADTLGVGGVFRALRTFPVLDQITEAMRAGSPDAWLLNYTNPMSMNVSYLARRHPDINALGLCHSVYWTVHDLGEIIGVPVGETDYEAAGVNHQSWLLRWERQGESLYPRLDAAIEADAELRRRVRVDMYQRIGFYPTETSEHSSEYVPWYLHDDREVERLRIPIDDYVGISAGNLAEYERTRADLAAGSELEPPDATEYAPQVIHSMVRGTARTIHANVANDDLISNLPAGLGVEVPTVVDGSGAHPRPMGKLPAACAALNRSFLGVVDLTVSAALEQDPRLVRRAMMVDPNTSATLRLDDIWALGDAMVEAHGDRLPMWLRE